MGIPGFRWIETAGCVTRPRGAHRATTSNREEEPVAESTRYGFLFSGSALSIAPAAHPNPGRPKEIRFIRRMRTCRNPRPFPPHDEVPVPLLCPAFSRTTATEKRHRYSFCCLILRHSPLLRALPPDEPEMTSSIDGRTELPIRPPSKDGLAICPTISARLILFGWSKTQSRPCAVCRGGPCGRSWGMLAPLMDVLP